MEDQEIDEGIMDNLIAQQDLTKSHVLEELNQDSEHEHQAGICPLIVSSKCVV